MKKPKFIAYICPVCGEKSVGNWEEKLKDWYFVHYFEKHFPKPIIK